VLAVQDTEDGIYGESPQHHLKLSLQLFTQVCCLLLS